LAAGDGRIPLGRGVVLSLSELELRASRSSGPGGQGVNTTDSKVELRWDVRRSPALTDVQRRLIEERLASRINAEGVLVLQGSEHRSQHRNREAVIARLQTLVADALVPPRPRRATRPTRGAKERRLEDKRARASTKELRRRPQD
jgi:ribosome-associated protein